MRGHIISLQAFVAHADRELNALPIFEYTVPIAADGAEMDKNIVAIVPCDKTKTLARIKPFDLTRLART